MHQYLDILQKLVTKYDSGSFKTDRTGTGTVSLFGTQSRFDLRKGQIPLLTTKKLHTKSIIKELLWFISGSTNNNDLEKDGVTIWSGWKLPNGDLGPIYGKQWRSWQTFDIISEEIGDNVVHKVFNGNPIDQLQKVIDTIRTNPTSRRMLITAWNPSVVPDEKLSPQANVELGKQCLPACHAFFQFNCEEIPKTKWIDWANPEPKYYLDCQVYVRSNDWFLGAPFNISQYGILTQLIGKLTNTYPRELVYTTGDTHLYLNHIDQAREQLTRQPMSNISTLVLDDVNWKGDINNVKFEDFQILGYEAHSSIKAPVAI